MAWENSTQTIQQLYKQYTKSNGNSIEFSLLTQTWDRFKLSCLEPYSSLLRDNSCFTLGRHNSYLILIRPGDLYNREEGRKTNTIIITITCHTP